jgi:hypothetical protein
MDLLIEWYKRWQAPTSTMVGDNGESITSNNSAFNLIVPETSDSFAATVGANTLYMGLSPLAVLHTFARNTITLIKLIMLQRKVRRLACCLG